MGGQGKPRGGLAGALGIGAAVATCLIGTAAVAVWKGPRLTRAREVRGVLYDVGERGGYVAEPSAPFSLAPTEPPPPTPDEAPVFLSPDKLFARTTPAVVRVNVHDPSLKVVGHGSGFFVTADGLVVTNFHVIQRAGFVTVETSDGVTLSVEGVAAADERADIALLKVKAGEPLPVLPLGADDPPPVGTKVYAIGHPRGLRNVLSEGLISAVGTGDEYHLPPLQTTAAISAGSSGGPLLTADGKVVGVTTAQLRDGQNLNFAVPVVYVHRLLEEQGQQPGRLRPLASAGVGTLDRDGTEAMHRVWAAVERRDWQEATRLVTELRGRYGESAVYWLTCGHLHLQLKNYDLAEEAYRTALKLKPDSAHARLNLGAIYLEQKKFEEALAECEAASKLDPKEPRAYANAGVAHVNAGRPDKAVPFIKWAIKLDPKNALYRRDLGHAYSAMKQHGDAMMEYREGLKLEPENAELHFKLAAVLYDLGRKDEAVESLKQALKLRPDAAPAYMLMGIIRFERKDYAGALNAFQNASRFDPIGRTGQMARKAIAEMRIQSPALPLPQ